MSCLILVASIFQGQMAWCYLPDDEDWYMINSMVNNCPLFLGVPAVREPAGGKTASGWIAIFYEFNFHCVQNALMAYIWFIMIERILPGDWCIYIYSTLYTIYIYIYKYHLKMMVWKGNSNKCHLNAVLWSASMLNFGAYLLSKWHSL